MELRLEGDGLTDRGTAHAARAIGRRPLGRMPLGFLQRREERL